ncbi:MAG: fibronectin type III domain-containing protein [bacterium]|nr:fibronectin type III domain-containing protein [bacterium]
MSFRPGRGVALAAALPVFLAVAVWGVPPSRPAAAQRAGFSTPTLAAGDHVTFTGAGWGHGAGISHQSLPSRIAAGQTAGDILGFYYPGTVLTGGWTLDNLRVHLASSSRSRFRPRGSFELVLDGAAVYSSSATELFTVNRVGDGWEVTTSGGTALCPGQVCDGDVLQIRTADGTAVESSATRHSYSHGQITLTKLPGNTWYRIVLTNLDLELYLRGVAEVPPDWPAEALRAQAVASRSYALHVALANRSSDKWNAPFDLYSTTMSQVYSGNTREFSPRNGPWLQAIADTAGQVLAYGGEPALTLFTTSGGGYTEASGYAFNEQHPYLVAAPDPFTAGDPYTPWTRTYSVDALSRWLARVPDTDVGTLRRIEVSGSISVSGRIDRATVRLVGSSATRSVSGSRFVFVVNKGAEAEGWGPMPNSAGRGGHLLSTLFVFGGSTSLPPAATPAAIPSIDPPGEPTALSLTPGAREIAVTWQPPTDTGGGPITGYLVTWVSSTGASGTIPVTETTRTLRNLANGATYTVSVAASNAGGSSRAVSATAAPLGVPSPPTDVSLRRGDGLLHVSWSPPAGDGGVPVESYAVHWTGPDGATDRAPEQGTQHTIGGLTNGATYRVTVTAVNRVGSSSHSAPASHRPGTIPTAPASISAVRGDRIVEVSWAPPLNDGGLPIAGYTLDWVSSTGAGGTIETTGTGYTMQNLLNGATYTVTVSAVNEAGTSPAGGTARATPAAAPGSPDAVTVDRGDGRLGVTWQPPASDGGKPVLSYAVAWAAPDGATGSVETTATSHTFDGLTNGTTYAVTVTASNEIGTSSPSQPASGTPAHIPGAPVAVRTVREDSRILVSWDPPASDGGLRVTGYTLLWVAPDGTTGSAETTATSHAIDGLTNGTTYGITVSATNEVGTSITADAVRATPARPPGPLAHAEIGVGHESLLVSWEPPTDDGGLPVRSYTLTWVAPDGAVTSIETTHTSHTIDGLIGGAAYTITILANNEMGASPAPMSAQAAPLHAAAVATGDAGDTGTTAVTTIAPPSGAAPSESVDEQPAPATAPAPAAAPQQAPTRTRAWYDSVTTDTAVIVLAAVGLVLIAALLVVTRRRRYAVEEAGTDVLDAW